MQGLISTARAVYERCVKELDPAREYTIDDLMPVFGLSRGTMYNLCALDKLECRRFKAKRAQDRILVTGAAAIAFARERMRDGRKNYYTANHTPKGDQQ